METLKNIGVFIGMWLLIAVIGVAIGSCGSDSDSSYMTKEEAIDRYDITLQDVVDYREYSEWDTLDELGYDVGTLMSKYREDNGEYELYEVVNLYPLSNLLTEIEYSDDIDPSYYDLIKKLVKMLNPVCLYGNYIIDDSTGMIHRTSLFEYEDCGAGDKKGFTKIYQDLDGVECYGETDFQNMLKDGYLTENGYTLCPKCFPTDEYKEYIGE